MSVTTCIPMASPMDVAQHGQHFPEIRNWKWMEPGSNNAAPRSFGMGSRRQVTHE